MTEPGPPEPAAASGRLRTAAYALAASAVGLPLVVVLLVRAVLFQLDPRGIVGADPAAYEVEYLAAGAIAGVVVVAAIARVFSLLARDDRAAVRYPTLIVQLQLGLAIAAVALALLTPGAG